MKLAGDYLFEAGVQEVWNALFDPKVLAAVMPGCEKLEKVDGSYVGELNIKVGPVNGKFTGKVDLKDIDEPKSYTMVVDGRGGPGFVKATAKVALEAEGEGTRIRYDADAQVGGKIASVGQRLIDASARAIVKESLEGLHENVKIRAKAYREAEAAAALASAPPPAPEPEFKQIKQSTIAAAVAKEVSKSLVPAPVLYAILIAAGLLLMWLVFQRL